MNLHQRHKKGGSALSHLRSIELLHILATVVAGVDADAAHFKAFPAKETLWHCIHSL